MADLVVVAFDQPDTADRVLRELTAMGKEELIELEDACVVVRPPQGEIQLKQTLPLTKLGALPLGGDRRAPVPQPARRHGGRRGRGRRHGCPRGPSLGLRHRR